MTVNILRDKRKTIRVAYFISLTPFFSCLNAEIIVVSYRCSKGRAQTAIQSANPKHAFTFHLHVMLVYNGLTYYS
jgi:hypothetical protein